MCCQSVMTVHMLPGRGGFSVAIVSKSFILYVRRVKLSVQTSLPWSHIVPMRVAVTDTELRPTYT